AKLAEGTGRDGQGETANGQRDLLLGQIESLAATQSEIALFVESLGADVQVVDGERGKRCRHLHDGGRYTYRAGADWNGGHYGVGRSVYDRNVVCAGVRNINRCAVRSDGQCKGLDERSENGVYHHIAGRVDHEDCASPIGDVGAAAVRGDGDAIEKDRS